MKILLAHKNLGCLGFRIHKNLYFDFYRKLDGWIGFFMNFKGYKLWIHRNGFKYEGKRDIVFRLFVDKLSVSRKHLLIH